MPVAVLTRFSRMAAGAATPEAILPLLADAAIENVGADGSVVYRVSEQGQVRCAASRGVPAEVAEVEVDIDELSSELARQLLARSDGRFANANILPLVSDGDLFGVLVLLFGPDHALADEQRRLSEALADLAAIAIARAAQYSALERSYQALQASRQALAQSEKLRALGQMAAGISHDLKNLLNPIALQLQLLRTRLSKGKDVASVLSQIEDTLKSGVQTVDQLRAFSRQDPERAAEPTDLDEVAHAALEICRPRLNMAAGLTVHEELGAPPHVLVRRADLLNAIVNLIVNAMDAMPDGGTITLRTAVEDDGAIVQVRDDGPGMPPEVAQRVFEPFFTTKAHGTGLGLANLYAFVQRQGGRVTLETAPDKGTAFTLWFPPQP